MSFVLFKYIGYDNRIYKIKCTISLHSVSSAPVSLHLSCLQTTDIGSENRWTNAYNGFYCSALAGVRWLEDQTSERYLLFCTGYQMILYSTIQQPAEKPLLHVICWRVPGISRRVRVQTSPSLIENWSGIEWAVREPWTLATLLLYSRAHCCVASSEFWKWIGMRTDEKWPILVLVYYLSSVIVLIQYWF